RDNLFSGWLRRRGEHLRHGADRDVLSELTVADAYEPDAVVIRESTRVRDLLAHLGNRDQSVFPVVDDAHRFVGVLTMNELGAVARGEAKKEAAVAEDLVQASDVVTLQDSLLDVVR